MAGCKRCAPKGGKKGKGKRREKKRKKEKGGENGDQNSFFCCCFFISPRARPVSRLSRSYPLLFAIKILMVSQFGDL